MKIKLPKLDINVLRELAVEHVEKILLGVIGVCCIVIAYQAVRRESYRKTEADLIKAAKDARDHVEQTQPVPMQIRDYPAIVALSRKPIKEEPYQLVTVPKPADTDQKKKRSTPQLLAVRDLRGYADKGAFDLEPPPGFNPNPAPPPTTKKSHSSKATATPAKIEPPRGQRWIVVTGVLALKDQFDEFNEVFHNVEWHNPDPKKDQPEYLGYWVERAEVVGSTAAEKLEWSKSMVSKNERGAAEKKWRHKSDTEVVDKDLILDKLAFPLGPLLGREWGPEAAHAPEIPLKSKDEKKVERKPVVEAQPAEVDETPFGEKKTHVKPKEAAPKPIEGPPEFALFRFFDFNVEPGKQYVYRVRLALRNPNYGLDQRYLERMEVGRKPFLETDWSEPTKPISVSRDVQVFATDVKPEGRVGARGDMLINRYDAYRGEENQKAAEVVRGDLMDYPGSKVRIQKKPPVYIKVDFLTGAVVLDFRGGTRLPDKEKTTAPGDILLLDGDGKLAIHNTLDDQLTLDRRRTKTPVDLEEKTGPGEDTERKDKGDTGLGELGGEGFGSEKEKK